MGSLIAYWDATDVIFKQLLSQINGLAINITDYSDILKCDSF